MITANTGVASDDELYLINNEKNQTILVSDNDSPNIPSPNQSDHDSDRNFLDKDYSFYVSTRNRTSFINTSTSQTIPFHNIFIEDINETHSLKDRKNDTANIPTMDSSILSSSISFHKTTKPSTSYFMYNDELNNMANKKGDPLISKNKGPISIFTSITPSPISQMTQNKNSIIVTTVPYNNTPTMMPVQNKNSSLLVVKETYIFDTTSGSSHGETLNPTLGLTASSNENLTIVGFTSSSSGAMKNEETEEENFFNKSRYPFLLATSIIVFMTLALASIFLLLFRRRRKRSTIERSNQLLHFVENPSCHTRDILPSAQTTYNYSNLLNSSTSSADNDDKSKMSRTVGISYDSYKLGGISQNIRQILSSGSNNSANGKEAVKESKNVLHNNSSKDATEILPTNKNASPKKPSPDNNCTSLSTANIESHETSSSIFPSLRAVSSSTVSNRTRTSSIEEFEQDLKSVLSKNSGKKLFPLSAITTLKGRKLSRNNSSQHTFDQSLTITSGSNISSSQLSQVSTNMLFSDGAFPVSSRATDEEKIHSSLSKFDDMFNRSLGSSITSLNKMHPLDWSNRSGLDNNNSVDTTMLTEIQINETGIDENPKVLSEILLPTAGSVKGCEKIEKRNLCFSDSSLSNTTLAMSIRSTSSEVTDKSRDFINDLVWLEKRIAESRKTQKSNQMNN